MRSYLGLVAQVCKAEEAIRAAYDKGYDDGILDRQNEAPESCSEQHVSENDPEALAAARAEGAEAAWAFALNCFVWSNTPERCFALKYGADKMSYHEAASAFNGSSKNATYKATWIEEQLAKARAEGSEEAWDFLRKINLVEDSLEYRWETTPLGAIENYQTYAEARAAFEEWKTERESWAPKRGDVVVCEGEEGVILEVVGQNAYVIWLHDGVGLCEINEMFPTGKYFDLTPIFEAMK